VVAKPTFEDYSTTEIHVTSNGQVIQLDNVGNAADSLLELRHFLEVTAQLDQRSGSEPIGIND
jgi:hypothetical protein